VDRADELVAYDGARYSGRERTARDVNVHFNGKISAICI